MNPLRRTVGELSTGNTPSDGLQTTSSQPKIVSHCDNHCIQPEGLRTVSRQTAVSYCDSNVLAKNTSSANIQTRGNASLDATLNSVHMPADGHTFMKNSKSISSQDAVMHVAASKVLLEKQCTSAEGVLCVEAAVESAACLSPARSAMEGLCCGDDDGAASPPSARLFSDSENHSPRSARIRRDHFSRSFDSIPTPRAPMKPTRVKSLNTLFPGKTRRRLDFDHL